MITLLFRKRRTRIALLFTFALLVVLRLTAFVPLPGIDLFAAAR